MKHKFGLLGGKLSHSISPLIHKMIFKELNIEGEYSLIETPEDMLFDKFLSLKEGKYSGINVTIPYKVSIMKYLDIISDEAVKIGSVNTIKFNGESTTGYNTDYYGFTALLKHFNIKPGNKKVLIIGSGGAALTVYSCMKDLEAEDITILTRNKSNISPVWLERGLMNNFIDYSGLNSIEYHDIAVNCTPVGMFPNTSISPLEVKWLRNFEAAVDLIYNPDETLFLKHAKENGLLAVSGLYMLVAQAVESENIWNNNQLNETHIDKIYNSIQKLVK